VHGIQLINHIGVIYFGNEGNRMKNDLLEIFKALQSQLSSELDSSRKILKHSGAKGGASEQGWIDVLTNHLPKRYEISRAFVIDSRGHSSQQIDLVIYDRQYTPVVFNKDKERVIPAESVYAVFEVKQELNKVNIKYAGDKIASVRTLERTSAPIIHAGGEFKPRPPIPILGGILTYKSTWKQSFGKSFQSAIKEYDHLKRLDLGCVIESGSFDAEYLENGAISLSTSSCEEGLAHFFIRLLHRLQCVGTVTAIDYDVYAKALESTDKFSFL
jgi:hypothetical protein